MTTAGMSYVTSDRVYAVDPRGTLVHASPPGLPIGFPQLVGALGGGPNYYGLLHPAGSTPSSLTVMPMVSQSPTEICSLLALDLTNQGNQLGARWCRHWSDRARRQSLALP